ncbi:hypothetical protein B0T21DRAFT_362041 [Apiosordaria backusii]|uniref:Uncharacterized protein n=1 Tax=Apiosordaria backusii TaxID=314023 RepID=A0AA40BRM3_9PEZI|nr:hypothetical protein B0T21DRAFT_362041 [Apiosordaria backusii]
MLMSFFTPESSCLPLIFNLQRKKTKGASKRRWQRNNCGARNPSNVPKIEASPGSLSTVHPDGIWDSLEKVFGNILKLHDIPPCPVSWILSKRSSKPDPLLTAGHPTKPQL